MFQKKWNSLHTSTDFIIRTQVKTITEISWYTGCLRVSNNSGESISAYVTLTRLRCINDNSYMCILPCFPLAWIR